ncbi:MAG: NlpC/P60 family protein [Armatimonadota bacterium]
MLNLRIFLAPLVLAFLAQSFAFGKTVSVRTEVRTAIVRVSTAKLRKSPTESGRTLGLLDHAASLTVLASKTGWVQVQTKRGTKGWIRRDLVSVTSSTVVTTKVVKAPAAVEKVTRKSLSKRPVKPTTSQRYVAKPEAKSAPGDNVPNVSNGQLPETVRTVKLADVNQLDIVDPIAEKRLSVVGFAQVVANSNKTSNPTRSTLMSRANSQRGTPYRYGTSGGGTFDCSGFTSAMYRKVGVRLPRTAAEQFGVGQHIAKASLTKGDLVFFRNTAGRRGVSHVGIYSGNGMFIHASSRGHAVRIDTISSGYYASHFAGGRRLIR